MTAPKRIQLRRTAGWKKPAGAIVVSRPSKWGNPWVVNPRLATTPARNHYRATAAEAVALYRSWVLFAAPFTADDVIDALAGHDLACWCPLVDADGLPVPCHADVLLEIANPR